MTEEKRPVGRPREPSILSTRRERVGTYTHPKVHLFASELGVERYSAYGLLGSMWSWATTALEDGDLTATTPKYLATVCGWDTQEADRLLDALIASGFVDRVDDRLVIHSWDEHEGADLNSYARVRQTNRETSARHYEKQRSKNSSDGSEGSSNTSETGYNGSNLSINKYRNQSTARLPIISD